MKQIILALVVLFAVASVEAQTFARVVTKTPSLTVMEVGDSRGLWALDIFSVDIHFNGGSMIAQLLAAALHESVPLPPNGRGIRWSVPNQDTVRLTVHGIDVSQYLIGIRACDLARVCADNSVVLPRFPGAASATMGFAPGAVTQPVNLMEGWISENGQSPFNFSVMQITLAQDTVITGFEGIGVASALYRTVAPAVYSAYRTARFNVYSNWTQIYSGNGDIANRQIMQVYPGQVYTPTGPSNDWETIEIRGAGGSVYLPAGTYYVTVALQNPPFDPNAFLLWSWAESVVDLGTGWSHLAVQSWALPAYTSPGWWSIPFTTGTIAMDLRGYTR